MLCQLPSLLLPPHHSVGYGPLGYFGPPANPGPFHVPPPPGYFPLPQPYGGPGYTDPNAAYSFPLGGYYGNNPPPTSDTDPSHPTVPESTVSEESFEWGPYVQCW